MINLFRKKNGGINVTDQVWINSAAKWKYVLYLWDLDHDTVFVFWFVDTLRQAEEFMADRETGKINLVTVREIHQYHQPSNTFIFCEHYPLFEREKEIFQRLQLRQVTVLSALDEPLFAHFGSGKIIRLMTQMGMDENEAIQHTLVTKAVQNAQHKIAGKVIVEQPARSQSSWLQNNLDK